MLWKYFRRLLKKWAGLVTGLLGFAVAPLIQLFFPQIGGAIVPLLVSLVAFTVVGYFVFADVVRECDKKAEEHERVIADLESKLAELESRQPRIVVGFQDQQGRLTKSLRFRLQSLPPEPDYNTLVQEKRSELLGKRPGSQPQSLQTSIGALAEAALSRTNPHYQEQVEQYPVELRRYLRRRYERKIAPDRARCLVPMVENQGHCPANSVTIEFAVPELFAAPQEHQLPDSTLSEEDYRALGVSIPPEQMREMQDARICGLPQEPSPTIIESHAFALLDHSDYSPPYQPPVEEPSNVEGPFNDVREGVRLVSYTVETLIQHLPETNFEPFWLWLASAANSTVLEIPVRVFCAELHTPLEDTLLLEITVDGLNPEDDAAE